MAAEDVEVSAVCSSVKAVRKRTAYLLGAARATKCAGLRGSTNRRLYLPVISRSNLFRRSTPPFCFLAGRRDGAACLFVALICLLSGCEHKLVVLEDCHHDFFALIHRPELWSRFKATLERCTVAIRSTHVLRVASVDTYCVVR